MKLFGDSGNKAHQASHKGAHTRSRAPEETVVISSVATLERKTPDTKKSGGGSRKKTKPSGGRAGLSRGKKALFITLGVLLLLILAVVIGYTIWEKPPDFDDSGMRNPVSPSPVVTPPVETTVPPTQKPVETDTPETPEPTEDPTPHHLENCYTFAILAYDQIGASTDTMLIGRMDINAGTLNVINIPRDTLVDVSWGIKKANTILGGVKNDMDQFKEELSEIIGFKVDCYAVVDIKAVSALVDAIGGVYYTVPRNMDYDDPSQNLSIHISKGYQLLNGENAVKVLRFREGNDGTGYATGDMGRIATQQDFLMSLASQMLSLGNIPNLTVAIDVFEQYVKTDMTASNIAFFAREFLLMDKNNISFLTAPGEATMIRSGSYYEINLDEWVTMLNERLNPFDKPIQAENLNILRKNGSEGAISSNGQIIPITSFQDYKKLSY